MAESFSFDIHILGLVDASPSGRTRFTSTMERLTGRPGSEFEQTFPKMDDAAFQNLDQEKARTVTTTEEGGGGVTPWKMSGRIRSLNNR